MVGVANGWGHLLEAWEHLTEVKEVVVEHLIEATVVEEVPLRKEVEGPQKEVEELKMEVEELKKEAEGPEMEEGGLKLDVEEGLTAFSK